MAPALEIRELRKHFGGLAVTRDLSLSLQPGERTALIGPNGAGKTTLINLVTGHLRPDHGQVFLQGRDITPLAPEARARAGLVRSFQVTRLFPEMTPEQHLALAILQQTGRGRAMFADYRTMQGLREQVAQILSALDLAAIARQPVGRIAYGQQRLLEIALAMALRPRVLLLDEPAAGVTGSDTHLIQRALSLLPADLAVLMIDHDMDFVFRFARRVVVLAAGAVICDGTPAQVMQDRGVREAYLGNYADDRRQP